MVKLPFFADQIPLVHDQIMVLFIMVKKKKKNSLQFMIIYSNIFTSREEKRGASGPQV